MAPTVMKSLESCEKELPYDYWHYVQIKPFHGSNHVYCLPSKILVNGKDKACPESMFLQPMGGNLTINEMMYVGLQDHWITKKRLTLAYDRQTGFFSRM